MTATLNTGAGEVATINLPSNLSEVPLNRYIDFIVECRAIGDPNKNQVSAMAKAAGAFYGLDLDSMVKMTLETDPEAQIIGLDQSLNTLYAYAIKLVREAAGVMLPPDQAHVHYMGETYHVPTFIQNSLGDSILPKISVIEAVECAEIRRVTSQTLEARGNPNGQLRKMVLDMLIGETGPGNIPKKEVLDKAEVFIKEETAKRGDPDGSLMYTMYLHLLAVLLRKDGEQMPIGDADRERWILERVDYFQHIDAQTALNLDFFLLHISRHSEQSPDAIGFLSRPMMALLLEMELRIEKQKPKPNRKTRRSLRGSDGGKSASYSLKKDGSGKLKKSIAQTLKTR